jgi:hypothetical protein
MPECGKYHTQKSENRDSNILNCMICGFQTDADLGASGTLLPSIDLMAGCS